MPWPLSQDYNEAIQNPTHCFTDPELRQGEAVTNEMGLPRPYSGNFADVYAVQTGHQKWAVKCFTRQIPGLRERYAEISKYLQQVQLPFMVDFKFLEQGILVRGQWYPVLKMQWAEGFTLNTFVRDNLDKPQILRTASHIWARMGTVLRQANLAHGDLQHGNVLLVPGSKAGTVSLKLVDYDGMCVPALELLKANEVGHPAYQHPQRLREGTYGLHIDRFSHLVVYTALRSLVVGGRTLWDKVDNGDNLLFSHKDFENPRGSALFQELLRLNDPEVKRLAQRVATAVLNSVEQTPILDDLVPVESVQTKPSVPAAAARVQAPQTTGVSAPASAPMQGYKDVNWSGAVAQPTFVRPGTGRGKFTLALLLGIGGIFAAAMIAGVLILLTPGNKENATAQAHLGGTLASSSESPVPPTHQTHLVPPTKQKPHPTSSIAQPVPKQVAKPETIATLEGHTSDVNSVAFSPDGKIVASGSSDKMIKLWDVASGDNTSTFNGHKSNVFSVAFSPDGKTLASGSTDKAIKLWDVASRTNTATLQGHTSEVKSVAFGSDGKTLASGSFDQTIVLWDVASGKNTATLLGHTRSVNSVAFSPNGKTLASGSADSTIKLRDIARDNKTATLEGPSQVCSVAFSPDGKTLASGSFDKTIALWDVASGTYTATLQGHTAAVSSVAFSPDGKTLASASFDKTVKLWDVASRRNIATLQGHTGSVNSVAFSPDGKTLASGSDDKTLRLWAIDPNVSTRPDSKPITSPEPKPLFKPEAIATFEGHASEVRSVAFSPDGKTLASGSGDKTIKLWDVVSGKNTATLKGHTAEVNSVAFSFDGKTLVSGSWDVKIKLWDVASGTNTATLKGHTADVNSVAFSFDGKTLASGGNDKMIKLWDVASGKNTATLKGHTAEVNSVAFSPNGETLVSASSDDTIKLWDIASGKNTATLQGHTASVRSVAFSSDGKRASINYFQ